MLMDERQVCVEALASALERLQRAQRRADDPALAPRLAALQAWQARRLAVEYADQRSLARRRDAVAFFLDEVYGARDYSARDAQFARAIHRLRAMLPLTALQALRDAVELQALTIELDVAVAERLAVGDAPLGATTYAAAYRDADRQVDRRRQIELAVSIGRRLEHLTAHPAIELMLRVAATPARLAGYGALQAFIERGYAAFRQLGPETDAFLTAIGEREEAFRRRTSAPPGEASDARVGAGVTP
jgi:hypothetical protein